MVRYSKLTWVCMVLLHVYGITAELGSCCNSCHRLLLFNFHHLLQSVNRTFLIPGATSLSGIEDC